MGEAYWSYVSQVVRGEPWCPVSSYREKRIPLGMRKDAMDDE